MGLLGEVIDTVEGHVAWHTENDRRIVNALKHVKHRTDGLHDVVRQVLVLMALQVAATVLLLVAVLLRGAW